jgi:hypothetical protein
MTGKESSNLLRRVAGRFSALGLRGWASKTSRSCRGNIGRRVQIVCASSYGQAQIHELPICIARGRPQAGILGDQQVLSASKRPK